jgi:hypothetical protein
MVSPMARGRRRGPFLLRFRALLVSLNLHAAKVVDTRQASKVRYSLQDCYVCAFALFYLQDPSVLEFQRRFQDQLRTNNLNSTFGVAQIPADSQFRDLLDSHDYEPLLGCFGDWIGRMQDAKWLQHYQFLDGRYLITMDGSQYFSSYQVNCECCLTATKNGTVRYHHDILQTAIVHPDKRQVLPLAPGFIHNADDSGAKNAKRRKQDCEIKAGYRAVQRIRNDHPRLAAVIVADSLYSKQPFIEQVRAARFSFLLVAKPEDHTSLYQDIDGLRRGRLLDHRCTIDATGDRHEYEWVTGVPLNGNPRSPQINFVHYRIVRAGTTTYRNAWVTDLVPTAGSVARIVRAGRARWKIENEGFNTLKNQGYHLEHNFGHGDKYLSEAFFVPGLLAYFMHQIFELVDGLYQQVRAGFGSRREFWGAVRATFRLFLFPSWDQVLVRMNSPPQPLSG